MKDILNIWLIIISATIGITAYTFLLPVNIIHLNSLGFSATKIGIFIAIPSVLVFLISPQLAYLLDRFGGKNLFFLSKIVICLAIPLFTVSDSFYLFCFVNFIIGLCAAFLWPFTDAYIAKYAPTDKKGHYTGLYQMFIGAAYTIGPVLAASYVMSYSEAIIVIFFISLASMIPMLFIKFKLEIGKRDAQKIKLLKYFLVAPFLMIVALIGGLFEVGTISMGTVHSLKLGFSGSQASYIVAAIGLGSFALQYPIGKIADKFDVTSLLKIFIFILFLTSVAIFYVTNFEGMIVIAIIWGAVGGGLYTLSIVAISKNYQDKTVDILTSLMVTIYTLGSMIAPAIAGFLIDGQGKLGLPIFLITISILSIFISFFFSKKTKLSR